MPLPPDLSKALDRAMLEQSFGSPKAAFLEVIGPDGLPEFIAPPRSAKTARETLLRKLRKAHITPTSEKFRAMRAQRAPTHSKGRRQRRQKNPWNLKAALRLANRAGKVRSTLYHNEELTIIWEDSSWVRTNVLDY
jgi:hypothetical protein